MIVDFTSTASIQAWLQLCPEQHLRQLRALYRLPLFANFRGAMEEAGKAVKGGA